MIRPTGWLPLAALALLVGLTTWLNQLVLSVMKVNRNSPKVAITEPSTINGLGPVRGSRPVRGTLVSGDHRITPGCRCGLRT